jgi:hypothetical protein
MAAVLDGEIDGFIDELSMRDETDRLQTFHDGGRTSAPDDDEA